MKMKKQTNDYNVNQGTAPAGNDLPEYEGMIKNIDTGKWVTGWNEKRVTYTSDEKKAMRIWDEAEANSDIEYLNYYFPACFTLLEERAGNDLPEQLSYRIQYRKGKYDRVVIEDEKGGFVAECGEVTAPSSEREAAEIVRRYNSLPALQEQNRELVKALKSSIALLNGVLRGSNSDLYCKEYLEPIINKAINIISKYSK